LQTGRVWKNPPGLFVCQSAFRGWLFLFGVIVRGVIARRVFCGEAISDLLVGDCFASLAMTQPITQSQIANLKSKILR